MEIRSFLAFELPSEIKHIISQVWDDLKRSPLNVRWVKKDNIHLTVIFLGQIDQDRLMALGEEAKKVCMAYGPFQVSLKGIGCFPNRRNPRVLWIGLDGHLERMNHFRDALQKSLKTFGIKEEKRTFQPHLTLGRFKKFNKMDSQLDECLLRYKDLSSSVFTLDDLTLFKSDLKPTGSEYTKLQSWPLLGKR